MRGGDTLDVTTPHGHPVTAAIALGVILTVRRRSTIESIQTKVNSIHIYFNYLISFILIN